MSHPNEPHYEVMWPLSNKAIDKRDASARLPDLNGKVICELWDVIFRGETIYPMVRDYIKSKFPGVKFVPYTEFGNFHGAREKEVTSLLAEKLKAHGADAVIVGIGA